MGKLSVVGNQHKAGGVFVQPARREKSLAPQVLRHQVHDGGLIFVLACADHSFGFIEHQIQVHPQAERLALHLHCVAVKVHSKIRRLYHLSVDSDRSLSDERFDLAAGKVALHRDCFIQPLFFAIVFLRILFVMVFSSTVVLPYCITRWYHKESLSKSKSAKRRAVFSASFGAWLLLFWTAV